MEGGSSNEQDERDLKRKAEDEEESKERERKGKAKVEEPKPEIRSFIDNDLHYLKVIGQHAVGSSSVEGVIRKLSRIRSKDVPNILGNQDGRLISIYSASGATIGIFKPRARFHRHAYLELLGTVDQVKIAKLLVADAITEKYDASSVPTAMMPLDICYKAMIMPFLQAVYIDGTNLARIEAESGAWLELDTSMDDQTWERVNIWGSEQQVKNAMEMINAVSEGPVLPENVFTMEAMDAFFEKYNEEGVAPWEDEMEAYFGTSGSGEVTVLKDSADTKNEEVEGKKSVEEGEQEERAESGSGTQKNVEESEDKKSVKEDEKKECVESGSGTQKNVEESEDKKSVKEDEQKECVDTGSGTQKEC